MSSLALFALGIKVRVSSCTSFRPQSRLRAASEGTLYLGLVVLPRDPNSVPLEVRGTDSSQNGGGSGPGRNGSRCPVLLSGRSHTSRGYFVSEKVGL